MPYAMSYTDVNTRLNADAVGIAFSQDWLTRDKVKRIAPEFLVLPRSHSTLRFKMKLKRKSIRRFRLDTSLSRRIIIKQHKRISVQLWIPI